MSPSIGSGGALRAAQHFAMASSIMSRWRFPNAAKPSAPGGQISIRAPVASINRFIEQERLSYGEAFDRLVAKLDR